ncbi:MAG: SET domain-containing protein [Spirochaetes bacterium]|nr:SET domain-containing protein [Spirochaetota bacterium]
MARYLIALILLVTSVGCSERYEEHLFVNKSRIPDAGNGVFTDRFIPAGAKLGSYGGRFITRKEHLLLVAQNRWHYVMKLKPCAASHTGGYTRIDGAQGNVFTRINYAPKPFQNVRFVKICDPPYVLVYATRDINPGEELYIDYGKNYRYDFMKYPRVVHYFEELGNARSASPSQ